MLAVALPGRAYPVTLPAISVVVDVAETAGYDVRRVAWTIDGLPDEPERWVGERLTEAAPEGCDLVVATSLGTWAAPYAAGRGWPAIWITPVLLEATVVEGIRANPAPQLVVCGSADPLHDSDVAAGLDCEVLELPGVDHALSSTGDAIVAPDILSRVADATADFLRRLP